MSAYSVTDEAQQVIHPSVRGLVVLQNQGSEPIYLGNEDDVESTTGLALAAGGTLQVNREHSGKSIFAVCADTKTSDLRVLVL